MTDRWDDDYSPVRGPKKKQSRAQQDRLQALASAATDKLREGGPWTADEVWSVAQLANAAPDIQLEDDLMECMHLFPAEELTKLSIMFDENKALQKAMQGHIPITCEGLAQMNKAQLEAVAHMKSFDIGELMERSVSSILALDGAIRPDVCFLILTNLSGLYNSIKALSKK